MPTTTRVAILIDFENVQPTVKELALLSAEHHRVVLFHGPHQNKFDAAMVKALQPLGVHVDYVQCGRNGKNALDFHIAFYLGRLVRDGELNGAGRDSEYVIVSQDSGFDVLLEHLQSLGHVARMVPSVREAVATRTSASTTSGGAFAPVHRAPHNPPVAAAAKAVTPAKTVKPPATTSTNPAPTLRERVIENLRAHPANRPSSRVALERHVATLAGNSKPSATAIAAVIDAMAREGILTIGDKAIVYALPKNGN